MSGSAATLLNNLPQALIIIFIALSVVPVYAATLAYRHFRFTRIEVLEGSLLLYSPGRFTKVNKEDVDRIGRIRYAQNFVRWRICTKSGKTYSINPDNFVNQQGLEQALENWALAIRRAKSEPEVLRSKSLINTTFLAFPLLAFNLVFIADRFVKTPTAFGLVLAALVAIFCLDMKYQIDGNQLVIRKFLGLVKTHISLTDISQVHFDPSENDLRFKIVTPHKELSLEQSELGVDYSQFRDLILLRATNARITGQTNPDKLLLCTLPGPLDQLHSKPLDPATADQDEVTVDA